MYVVFMYERGEFTDSVLFALDAASGETRWSRTIAHVGNEPVVADGIIYWSSFEGSVHAIDEAGRPLWTAPGTDSNIGVPSLDDENRLFVSEIAGGSKYTWCLDRMSGATLWRFAHGGHSFRLTHADGRVYHASMAPTDMDEPPRGSLYCLDARTGRVQWSVTGREYLFNPVVIGERVYICSPRTLYIHRAADGRRLGEAELRGESGTVTAAAGTDRVVLWGNDSDETGDWVAAYTIERVRRLFGGEGARVTRLWRVHEAAGLCDAPLTLTADRLGYLTRDGVVRIIAAATGERLAELKLGTKTSEFGGMATGDDSLIVAHGREVFAFPPGH